MLKYLIGILFLASLSISFAQEKRILPPLGNNILITDIAFTPDSKRVVSVGFDNKVVVWDIASKKAIKSASLHKSPIWSVRFSSKGDRFITASEDSTLKIWDAKTYEFIQSIKLDVPLNFAEFDKEDAHIICSSPTGKVHILDAENYEVYKVYHIEGGFMNQAIFSTNGKLFFTGDEPGNLKCYGVEDGKEYINANLETAVKHLLFSKDRSILVAHLYSGRAEMFQMPDMKALGAFPIQSTELTKTLRLTSTIDFSKDSKYVAAAAENGRVNIIQLATMMQRGILTKHSFILKCLYSPNDRYVAALGTDLTITIMDMLNYDFDDSKQIPFRFLRQESDLPQLMHFHPDSTIAFSGFYSNHWDMKTGIFTNLPYFEENYQDFMVQSELVQLENHTFYFDVALMTFLIKSDHISKPSNLVLSQNEHFLAYEYQNSIYTISLHEKILISQLPIEKGVLAVDNSGKHTISKTSEGIKINKKKVKTPYGISSADVYGTKIIAGTLEDQVYLIGVEKGKILATHQVIRGAASEVKFVNSESEALLAGFQEKIELINPETGEVKAVLKLDNSITDKIAVSQDGQLISVLGDDRIIRIIKNNTTRLNQLYQIYTLKNRGCVAINEENYYISGNGAHKELAFYYKDKVYPGAYFDLDYNRPDLVLASSPYASKETIAFYAEIVESRKNKTASGFNLELPFIEFINKSAYELRVESKLLKMKCILPVDFSEKDLSFFNNNVPIYPKTNRVGDSLEINYALIPGKNKLEICANKEHHFGLKDYYDITYDIKQKPELYLVCLGVSEYEKSTFNLNYASKDTKDFYDEISRSTAFKNINKKLYLNEEVTKLKLQEIQQFLAQAREEDVVIVFIAGHGVLDADFTYYFATHDMDFDQPKKKGISFYDLEAMLSNIKAINKVLFMDTCHSGELDEEEVLANNEKTEDGEVTFRGSTSIKYSQDYQKKTTYMNALFSDLRTNNGAVILSSSSGVEFSMEGDEWKNGLFTYCLLKGLRENKGDLNRDGKVKINELLNYVSNQVYFLSGGRQRPNLRQSNLSLDLQLK